jgi:hypothetical protein
MATSTFNPEASSGTYTQDGNHYGDWSTTWATVHDAAAVTSSVYSANTITFTDATSTPSGGIRTNTSLGYNIGRAYYNFRYSIPAGKTITGAKISLFINNVGDDVNDADSFIRVVEFTGGATAYSNDDYNNYGTTAWANDLDLSSITAGAYNDFTFNATGLAQLVADGSYHVIKLATREGHDVNNSGGSLGYAANKNSGIGVYFADYSSGSRAPVLTITYDDGTTSNFFAFF